MNKKGQAAMEFLLTYGWAILVVLLVIGALAYFGLLNPRQFLPNRCNMDNPLRCSAYQIQADGTINIQIENANSNAITLTDFSADDTEGFLSDTCSSLDLGDATIPAGGKTEISINCGDLSTYSGQKISLALVVDWDDKVSTFSHSTSGTLLSAVEN